MDGRRKVGGEFGEPLSHGSGIIPNNALGGRPSRWAADAERSARVGLAHSAGLVMTHSGLWDWLNR